MTSSARYTLWIACGGVMAAIGWICATPEPAAPAASTAPKVARSRGDGVERGKLTLPLLSERIDARFGDWMDSDGRPSLSKKLAELNALRSWELRGIGRVLLAEELAEGNVGESVARLVSEIQSDESNPSDAMGALAVLIDTLAGQDPERAWEILTGLPKDLIESSAILGRSIIIARLKTDPDSVFNYVTSQFSSYNQQRESLWGLIATELVAVDLQLARKALARMPGDHGLAVSAVASKWAESDPEAAIRWASRFHSFGPNPAIAVFMDWMEQDPHAALAMEEQFSIGTFSGQMSVREQLASYWARLDAKDALDWGLGEHGGNYLREVVQGISNPKRVLELARARSADAELQIAPHLAQGFARSDPNGALVWLRGLPEDPRANLASMLALNGMGYADPAAQEIGRANFDQLWRPEIDITRIGQGYHYGQEGVARGILLLFAEEPERLWELVGEASASTGKLDQLVREVAGFDDSATARYLVDHHDEISQSTIRSVIDEWSKRDPLAAGAFKEEHQEILGLKK